MIQFAAVLTALACGQVSRAPDTAAQGGPSSTSDGGAPSGSGALGTTAATSDGTRSTTDANTEDTSTSGSSGGTGNHGTGGGAASGGAASGGEASGGEASGGEASGGAGDTTASGASGGSGGAGGTGGALAVGPCDLYESAGTPCVAAYSMVRRLSSSYDGPLYQVRSGSSSQNVGTGGDTHDIGMTASGFGDAAAQNAICNGTTCTISLVYDQSGQGNHLSLAPPADFGGQVWDNFESLADAGPMTIDGHEVYSLFMEARQGYRQAGPGSGIPVGQDPQGIYLLADGTHYGTACCWDFGNVGPEPAFTPRTNALFFGIGFWGRGALDGPWFMADFLEGVWAGGSNPGDPGWGGLNEDAPPNTNNLALPVPFAVGFLKTNQSDWALKMADAQAADSLTTAYQGALPVVLDNQGAAAIGVSDDSSANSWGTFYEGAIVAGWPSDEAEAAVLANIRSAGYW